MVRVRARLLLAGCVLLFLVILGFYVGRNVVAERLARRWFAERRIPAGLAVQSLSLTGFTASVRLGPPADPDFTVERLRVTYAISWDGRQFALHTGSIGFWRPRLKARLVGGRLSLGRLDGLIAELQRRPAGPGPAPDVVVSDGVLTLATPAGAITIQGGGVAPQGRIATAFGRVAPFALTASGVRLEGAGGDFRIVRQGARLAAVFGLGPLAASGSAGRLRLGRTALAADLPPPTPAWRFAGPAQLTLTTTGATAQLRPAQATDGALQATFRGGLAADAASQSFTGRLVATGDASAIYVEGASARRAEARVVFPQLRLVRAARDLTADAGGVATVEGLALRLEGVSVEQMTSAVRVQGARLRDDGHGLKVRAALSGALWGRGGFAPGEARRLADRTPVLSGEPAYQSATERALQAFRFKAPVWTGQIGERGAVFALPAPAVLESASGGRLTLLGRLALDPGGAAGNARLSANGGGLPAIRAQLARWTVNATGFQTDLSFSGIVDAYFARGANLTGAGRATLTGGRFRFDLAGCTPIAARRLAFDPNPVADFAGRICPMGGSLIEAGPDGWTVQGRLEAAQGQAPSFAADISDASGAFHATGGAKGIAAATLALDHGRVSDTTSPSRMRPVEGRGRLELAHGVWVGDLAAATPSGRPIARLQIRDDLAAGAGRADIDAHGLAFALGALQPADLSPLASFAKDAVGGAAFTGWFAWAPGGAHSSGGRLVARDLKFRTPAGMVLGIAADLKFNSLAPLATAPDQHLTVREVQSVLPLTKLAATFDFDDKAADLDAAGAEFADGHIGLESMTAPFAEGSTTKGVLVLDHVNLGKIIAATNLAKAMTMDAVVDARIPFEATPSGSVRITGGTLEAVRPGRLSIARAALGAASGQTDVAREFAYQAIENLAFDKLDAELNSIEGDRLRILFHLKGRHDPPQKARATIAIGELMAGKVRKPIPLPSGTGINLTLDSTLNFGELARALSEAWRESVGGQGRPSRSAPVQGPAPPVSAR